MRPTEVVEVACLDGRTASQGGYLNEGMIRIIIVICSHNAVDRTPTQLYKYQGRSGNLPNKYLNCRNSNIGVAWAIGERLRRGLFEGVEMYAPEWPYRRGHAPKLSPAAPKQTAEG